MSKTIMLGEKLTEKEEQILKVGISKFPWLKKEIENIIMNSNQENYEEMLKVLKEIYEKLEGGVKRDVNIIERLEKN